MDPFIGEIRLLPYTFSPQDWYPCDGRLLAPQIYQALFSLIGNRFGGDGKTSFALPNLSNQAVLGAGQGAGLANVYAFGKKTGASGVTLTAATVPSHAHTFQGLAVTPSAATATPTPQATAQLTRATVVATNKLTQLYSTAAAADATLHPAVIGPGPTSQGIAAPHENRQPFLALRFCICVQNGIYPVRP
ncbi:microcystin-dependent protein [Azospirillum fermentarium]|uniref:phage tail protein n=1 Tax=Azospirillum fermentarium TaxID=1233114 RepID=UPI002226FC1C|nr:tail fiber protein [Azospirillum fermentarium]MCW2249586.1 microcystin-dependent protein [Azospirillum fermentarium]